MNRSKIRLISRKEFEEKGENFEKELKKEFEEKGKNIRKDLEKKAR